MKKTSSENITCTWCDADALPGTNPPACAEHIEMSKTASEGGGEPSSLKELQSRE